MIAEKVKVEVDSNHKKVYLTPYTPREKRTLGQKAADAITSWAGSWEFICLFLFFLVLWMITNAYLLTQSFDPYPFILLNLVLSCVAAIQAPVILMSQNRAAERDRAKAQQDYLIDKKAEMEIKDMQQDLEEIKKMLKALSKKK